MTTLMMLTMLMTISNQLPGRVQKSRKQLDEFANRLTCAHIRTHARAHIRTHVRAHIRTHVRAHIRTQVRVHIRTHARTHVRK
jgi:hypothetical protein